MFLKQINIFNEVIMPLEAQIIAYNNPVKVKINEEFKLQAGQHVYLKEDDLKITFISVLADTRNRNETNSVLSGNAEVLFIISHEGKETEACLSTDKENRSVLVKNYKIVLKNLTPYPSESRIIFHSRYTADLIVKRNLEKIFS